MTDNWKEITDPEELFKLKREGWEMECFDSFYACWNEWNGRRWNSEAKFRARPRQPKMKKIKMLCWYRKGYLLSWAEENFNMGKGYVRFPAGDIDGEVPE